MRGKHGQAAAVRHEQQAATAEIETYKRAVARLTQERNDARAKLADEQTAHRTTRRELLARLNVAAAPRVEALQLVEASLRAKLTAVEAEVRRCTDDVRRLAQDTVRHYSNVHGMTYEDALRTVSDSFGINTLGTIEHNAINGNADPDEIDRARVFDRALERKKHREGDARTVTVHGRLG